MRTQNRISPRRSVLFGVAWIVVLILGLTKLMQFQMTPGTAAAAVNWPRDIPVKLAADRPTLIMFVHPGCACSSASMEELARVATLCENRVEMNVVFFKPSGQSDAWVQTGLWKSAQLIPGVRPIIDEDGVISTRFDAETSGQVDLFNPRGELLFTGGITGSRGHAGDNAGASAVVALINQPDQISAGQPVRAKVYGCAISDSRRTIFDLPETGEHAP